MSKQRRGTRKHRQQSRGIAVPKKWLPLIGITIGLLVVVASVIVIAAHPAGEPRVIGAPAIEVEQSFFDLGDMHFNKMAQVTYQIKNVGDQPLRILETPHVQVVEGC